MAFPSRLTTLSDGLLGAEIATWWALTPSLIVRPWWATASSLAFSQTVGHLAGSGLGYLTRRVSWRPRLALAAITAGSVIQAARRQRQQLRWLGDDTRTHPTASLAAGVGLGTLGYGAALLLGAAVEKSYRLTAGGLRRLLPGAAATWTALGLVAVGWVATWDRLLVRRIVIHIGEQAEFDNRVVYEGLIPPREEERSGSPHSFEPWETLGAQGRATVAGGPRAADIAAVTGRPAREPIRVFAGKVEGRSIEETADAVLAELERTGAFSRSAIVLTTSTGTGWITDWSLCAYEFLLAGDCASASLQFSYLPSALSFIHASAEPVLAARALIERVLARPERPRVYLAGESLGAYGTATAFPDLAALLAAADGVVLTGAPRFTPIIARLTRAREPGSPERLPLIDAGRRVRFVAHPDHLRHDYRGAAYEAAWEHPRLVVGQHASDPIVWWSPQLFYRRPDWLREPGSRGVRAPRAEHLDVFQNMRWIPLLTGWQVGIDMATSIHVPGGHGHNYHAEFLDYWNAVLVDAPVALTPQLREHAAAWIRDNQVRG